MTDNNGKALQEAKALLSAFPISHTADRLKTALAALVEAVEAAPVANLLPRSDPFALDWIAMGDADNESQMNALVGQRVRVLAVGEDG